MSDEQKKFLYVRELIRFDLCHYLDLQNKKLNFRILKTDQIFNKVIVNFMNN